MDGGQSPDALKNLVLVTLGISILGILMALGGYFTVDLPAQQQAMQAPENKFQAPWYDPDCTDVCNARYLAHEINSAAWFACCSTCCGGGITC
jgi:hypothetical protein